MIRQAEKDRFGEVFTPPAIINSMLDQLPPEVWSDPTKKWLDPAAGFGNFFMEVYPRLMKSLEHVIKEPLQRRRHILTQMLYMVEVNPESCVRIRENPLFFDDDDNDNDDDNRIYVNLFCGDFLDPMTITEGSPAHFDIIVGNPPFNAEQTHEGKKGGGAILWPKFVEKSLCGDLLQPDGYLVFVHPALWRKPPSSSPVSTLFHKMTHDNHMLYLEIHNKQDGKRDFGVQTRYDYYMIQKCPPSQKHRYLTRIKDQTGRIHESVDLSAWHFFLPNHSFEIIKPLLLSPSAPDSEDASCDINTSSNSNSNSNSNSIVLFSRCQYGSDQKWVSDTQDETHIYPVVHSTPKAGPRVMWSSKRNTMFGVPKVIFGESGIHDVIIDIEGKYGMTQGAIGLKIQRALCENNNLEAEAQQMKCVLESPEFHTILDAMSFSNFRIDWRTFLYFRPDFYKKVLVS